MWISWENVESSNGAYHVSRKSNSSGFREFAQHAIFMRQHGIEQQHRAMTNQSPETDDFRGRFMKQTISGATTENYGCGNPHHLANTG